MTLPYTYTDCDGDVLVVSLNQIKTTCFYDGDPEETSVTTPPAPDAIALARAILEAAGDTGHVVIPQEEIGIATEILVRRVAESMRERAANVATRVNFGGGVAALIRALPLLPEGEPNRTPTTGDTPA